MRGSSRNRSPQIVIRNFPALDRKWLATGKFMDSPHWSADGKELLAVQRGEGGAHLMSIPLAPDAAAPNPGDPRDLFLLDPRIAEIAPNADHSRLLVLRDVKASG